MKKMHSKNSNLILGQIKLYTEGRLHKNLKNFRHSNSGFNITAPGRGRDRSDSCSYSRKGRYWNRKRGVGERIQCVTKTNPSFSLSLRWFTNSGIEKWPRDAGTFEFEGKKLSLTQPRGANCISVYRKFFYTFRLFVGVWINSRVYSIPRLFHWIEFSWAATVVGLRGPLKSIQFFFNITFLSSEFSLPSSLLFFREFSKRERGRETRYWIEEERVSTQIWEMRKTYLVDQQDRKEGRKFRYEDRSCFVSLFPLFLPCVSLIYLALVTFYPALSFFSLLVSTKFVLPSLLFFPEVTSHLFRWLFRQL